MIIRPMIKRLIKLETLRENPSAGQAGALIPVSSTLTVSGSAKPPTDGQLAQAGMRLTGSKMSAGKEGVFWSWEAIGSSEDSLRQLSDAGYDTSGVRFSFQNVYRDVRSIHPEPDHLFEREDPEITCQYCGGRFPSSLIICDPDDQCPECLAGGCCEVVDETVEEALERRRNL